MARPKKTAVCYLNHPCGRARALWNDATGTLNGKRRRPCKAEGEHLDEFRRTTLSFILREFRKQES